jgi:thiosulfate/3-mercaptopyruvate sulfurtransferase
MAFGPLVRADWLLARLDAADVRVVDCRWRLGEPGAGERGWLEGHVPGAAFLDVDRDLSGAPGDRGRHPLPAPVDFERVARAAGIGAGTRVVAYDDAEVGGAARLWWLLRHFGHVEVAVLDGGLAAWVEAGGPLESGRPQVRAGDFAARPRTRDVAGAEELLRRVGDPALALLDARAPERYHGEVEPVDPVAGHVPGARNAPLAALAPGGRYREPDELRSLLEAAGADGSRELVAYCGSGVTACGVLLAAELAGLGEGRLYPGSWSEWSRRGLPRAAGEEP